MTPGDILITLRTCGDLRRGDVVTVSHTSPSGEYVYLDDRGGRQAFRSDAFMVAVKRPWHAWADPEWERRAREAAARFVKEGIPATACADHGARTSVTSFGAYCIACGDRIEYPSPSPAPVATEAEIRAQAFEYIAQRLEAKARSADLGATFWHGALHGTSIYNFFTYAADEVRALAEKETSR